MPLLDRGGERRLRKLEEAFAQDLPSGKRLEKLARDYGRVLTDAMRERPSEAGRVFREYDARVPSSVYGVAFPPESRELLAGLASSQDLDVLTVTFEVAGRLGLSTVQGPALEGLAGAVGGQGDADRLVSQLDRWRDAGLLTREVVEISLGAHLKKTRFSRDEKLWRDFFTALPESLIPELFAVQVFVGNGAQAVRLANSAAQRQEALECCLRSSRLDDLRAGIELARREGDERLKALEGRIGELLFALGEYEEALAHLRVAKRQDLESECHEQLGQLDEALATCPTDQTERLGRLARACWDAIDGLVEQRDYERAVRRAREILDRLAEVAVLGPVLTELSARRDAVVAAGRAHFERLTNATVPDEKDAKYREWSRFEETSGETSAAAERAEQGRDLYRAHGLYLKAGRPGDAERVLRNEPERWRDRAAAREAGGDVMGAAELHAKAGEHEQAAALYLSADRHAEAAECLIAWQGDEAIEDPRLIQCLRRTGDTERLAELSLRAVKRRGRATAGLEELKRLRDENLLPPHLEAEILRTLEEMGAQGRKPFEERAASWVTKARREVDERFASIWALDLGTTTCAVAIYDSQKGHPVLCPWKGRLFFASTLTVDGDGNERVGVDGEEVLAEWVKGFIGAAKRRIGGATRYKVRGRVYRTEEVAARLIAHARSMVEDFLAERVRDRVAELARQELGEARAEWLDWLADEHDLRLERPRAILTIPAFFRNNQKQATRNACRIAGVEPARLIHEPTAACIAAARQRRLSGQIVVVDLGAGTLDLSALDVDDGVYDVHQVHGDNDFGGKDFDTAIAQALERRLEREGVRVPAKGKDRMRFEIAVEHLKIDLSGQPQAGYPLPGFAGDPGFRLELDRDELAAILAGPLRTLRATCERLRDALRERPEHLVLVGGPMLAPPVAELIEDVFGLRRTVLADPRTAVAAGAAYQAAVLSGVLTEQVLMDLTPLALGLHISPAPGEEEFSPLIEAGTRIPAERKGTYTTTRDDQDIVRIQIYNGDLRPESKIGEFQLGDIAPAAAGEPEIEVTFAIDASCVLEVTARDALTGNQNSIRVSDTTLLSPDEIARMTERHRAQRDDEERRRRLGEVLEELSGLAGEARLVDAEGPLREFRRRLDGRHTPPSDLDSGTERVLAEIYGPAAAELEIELLAMRGPLQDLVAKTDEYLAADNPDLATGLHLHARLSEQLDRLRPGLAQVALWNSVLARLAATEADPLARFRGHHATGDYARALAALAELPEPPSDPDDVRRHLHCLAKTGAADDYRRVHTENAGRLGAAVLDPARPGEFLRRVRPALVRIGDGSGFLISDRLVVTGHEPSGDVETSDGPRRVGHVFAPDSSHLHVRVLQLNEPMTASPLALGHTDLVRIGDRVHAVDRETLVPGVIDAFEPFPEQDLRLYRLRLPLPRESGGGPLFNDLGEVIGVLTTPTSGATFAITLDSLAALLASTGFGASS